MAPFWTREYIQAFVLKSIRRNVLIPRETIDLTLRLFEDLPPSEDWIDVVVDVHERFRIEISPEDWESIETALDIVHLIEQALAGEKLKLPEPHDHGVIIYFKQF